MEEEKDEVKVLRGPRIAVGELSTMITSTAQSTESLLNNVKPGRENNSENVAEDEWFGGTFED